MFAEFILLTRSTYSVTLGIYLKNYHSTMMKLVYEKFLFFSFTVALIGRATICQSEGKTEISHGYSITEIKSLRDTKTEDELTEGDRVKVCNEGLEVVRREILPEIRSDVGKNSVEGPKKYLVQLIGLSREIRYSMKVLPAFKCPTSPSIYIHVRSYDKITGNMKFLVITKDISPAPNLKYINSYGIRLVKNITEAFLEEIPREMERNSPGISTIDADELPEEERLRICRRAATTISEMNVTFLENGIASTNKYYSAKEERRGTDHQLRTISSIVHAFKCPTDPEIYIHIETEEDDEKTLWVITTESERYPIFGILGFLLQPVLDVTEVSSDELKTHDHYDHTFSVDFEELGKKARRRVCAKSILVTLGSKVELSENGEVEKSKLYTIKIEDRSGIIHDMITRAIKCPTIPFGDVYVWVGSHADVGNLSWVFLKKNELYEELSPWG